MNNQTQSPAPDFGFIVNQPDLEPKKKRPTVLLFVGIGVVALLLGVAVLSSVLSKSSKQPNQSTIAAQQAAAQKSAQQYFTDITGGQTANAYALFSADLQKNFTSEQFSQFTTNTLSVSFDLPKCAAKSQPQISGQTAAVTYTCPTKDGKYMADFNLGLVTDGEGYKIDSYDIKATPV